MKKIVSLFLCISLIMALFVPTMIFSAGATTVADGNIDLSELEFGYALRGTAETVYPTYNATDDCYDITMPSNSKHAFLVSDTKTNGGSYTISVEYKMNSTDGNAQVGFILGASKNDSVIDLTTAYKMQVYKAADRYRFSACNGATPDLVGANVSFDRNYTDKGVTYNEDVWNTMSMTVRKDGIITMTVNGVLVFNQKLPGHYINGYVGLYSYVPGTQFRNFNIVEKENEIDMSEMEFGYALRGDATNTSVNYNGTNDAYDLRMPSNAKDAFYVSDTKANGNSYTVSVEYKSTSADANMCVGFVLGASKNEEVIDLSTAYKMWVYTNTDRIRFTSCDAATPRDTNGTYGRNYTGIGVTYNSDGWNKMSMTVTKEGIVTLTVNGVLVYSSQNDGTYSKGYIGGYVGLHAYLPGVQVRNFTFVEQEDEVDMSEMEFVYALRGAATNTSIKYNAANGAYDLTMPSNAKDAFFISDTKTNGGTYTVSVEYKSTSTDNNMAVGLVLGASKDAAGVIDITTAYKMCVYTNVDRAFFNSCDGATPRDNGVSYSRNYTSVGVTYNNDGWNKMSMTVTKDGVVTLTVNGVLVYKSQADGKYSKGYIDGYVGLTATFTGLQFRNFKYIECTEHSYVANTTPATCTEVGKVVYTCKCGEVYEEIIEATDHNCEAVVTDPTCTAGGYTTYTCACGYTYVADETEAAGHKYANPCDADCDVCGETRTPSEHVYGEDNLCINCGKENENVDLPEVPIECTHEKTTTKTVDATCTKDGSTTVTCDACGETISTEVIEAKGHTISDWIVETPAKPGIAGLKYKACSVCGAERVEEAIEAVKLIGIGGLTLTLESNIAINYRINSNYFSTYGYDEIYLVVDFNGKKTTIRDYVMDGDRLVFTFSDVSANMMSDSVLATAYGVYDGEVYECRNLEYSVVKYAKDQIAGFSGELLTLLVDLLNYGTVAQQYTGNNLENLANAWLSAEQIAAGTQTDRTPVSITAAKYEAIDSPIAKWRGATLVLEAAVTVRYKILIEEDITGMTAVFECDGDTYTVDSSEFEPAGDNHYYIYISKLNAAQMSSPLYGYIVKDGAHISNTIRYSIESYVADSYTDTSVPYLNELIKAMLKYGDSAYNYIH